MHISSLYSLAMQTGNTNRVQVSECCVPSCLLTTAHFKVAHNRTKESPEVVQTDCLKTLLLHVISPASTVRP